MVSRKWLSMFAVLLITLAFLAACTGSGTGQPAASTSAIQTQVQVGQPTPLPIPTNAAGVSSGETPGTNPPVSLAETLGNLSYTGILPDNLIKLTDGIAYYDDGSSAKPSVRFNNRLIAKGDLNGDGAEDAVILLENESSGTGRFVYLVSVLDAEGNPTPAKAVLIGDRIRVKSLAVEGNRVIADLIAQGPGDPACCPSWNVRKIFTMGEDQLVERSSQEISQISLEDLNGTNWRLVDLNAKQEPVLPDTEITLQIADGQLSGFAGCNDYNSTISSKPGNPNSYVVGPIATTKKICSDPVMNQENTYLTRLGKSTAWWFDAGHLELVYDMGENGPGYLEFEAAGPAATQTPTP